MYRLRELERKDLREINKWRNDKDLIDCLGATFRFINNEVDEKWFDNYMSSRNTQVRCSIVDESDNILGLVSLVKIDNINQSAELHIMIGGLNNRGKGIGTFAVKGVLNHAFFNLNLNRIELTVLSNNERAIALYEKIGFKREGIKRKARYKNGKFVDMILYSLLKDEYYEC